MTYDDLLTISTPEGVDLQLVLAGAASRFVSAIVDILLQVVLLLCIGAALAAFFGAGFGQRPGVVVLIWAVVSFLVVTGYDVFFEVLNSGRTPGKMLNGLRVVRIEGHPVTFVSSLIRNSLRIIDFLPSAYLLGAVVILASHKNQRIGDVVAGTLVVREGGRPAPAQAELRPGRGSAATDAIWDTSRITVDELSAVRQFLTRRNSLELSARAEIANTMAERLRPKVAGIGLDVRGEEFLEALVAAKSERR